MKLYPAFFLFGALLVAPAYARNTVVDIPLNDVLSMPEAKEKLDGSVRFYLAGQDAPKISSPMGEVISNHKTESIAKEDDTAACRWVILTALIDLQRVAKRHGADAVVDIVSYYKKNETKSDSTIRCHAGGLIAGATLKGTYGKVIK